MFIIRHFAVIPFDTLVFIPCLLSNPFKMLFLCFSLQDWHGSVIGVINKSYPVYNSNSASIDASTFSVKFMPPRKKRKTAAPRAGEPGRALKRPSRGPMVPRGTTPFRLVSPFEPTTNCSPAQIAIGRSGSLRPRGGKTKPTGERLPTRRGLNGSAWRCSLPLAPAVPRPPRSCPAAGGSRP